MKNKTVVKSQFFGRLSRIFVLLFFLGALLVATRGVVRLINSGYRVQEAKNRLQEATNKQEELKYRLEEIKSSFYKEKVAREQLGLARSGEIVLVLPDEAVLKKISPRFNESQEIGKVEPNWKKWAKLFFNLNL